MIKPALYKNKIKPALYKNKVHFLCLFNILDWSLTNAYFGGSFGLFVCGNSVYEMFPILLKNKLFTNGHITNSFTS